MPLQLSVDEIKRNILMVRGFPILLDSHLSKLYEVETRYLNKAVRRNIVRFPGDFRFQLLAHEVPADRKHGGLRKLPYAYTQEGVAMLSGLLNTDRAIQVNISVLRAYVALRMDSGKETTFSQRLDQIDAQLKQLIEQSRQSVSVQYPAPAITTISKFNRPMPLLEEVESIKIRVSHYFGLPPEALNQTTRAASIAIPRQIAIYLIRKHTSLSYKKIARHFGLGDHTTILHACRKIEAAVKQKNPEILAVLKAF